MTLRARRTFRTLVVAAVAATGALSRSLAASPGATTGLAVAASALAVAAATLLALRILVVIGRHPAGGIAPPED